MYGKLIRLAWVAALLAACGSNDGSSNPGGSSGGQSSAGGQSGSGGALQGSGGSTSSSGGSSTSTSGGSGHGSGGDNTSGGGTSPGSGGGSGGSDGPGTGGASAQLEWLPSWATTIQIMDKSNPDNVPPSLGGNTLRQFIWPTFSGEQVRIQLSNEKGESPLQIAQVHIALAKTTNDPANSGGAIDASTDAAFTFDGQPGVTIPPGETVWSDGIDFALEEVKLTAITMQFGSAIPTTITTHPGSRSKSYIESGDMVAQESMSGAETRERWYFIDALEVMAPADAYAIAILGDSITDGYGVHDAFARWPDAFTSKLKQDPQIADKRSILDFGMGANNLTVTDTYQDAGLVRFERDVLTREKIKWLIVFEGVNDIIFSKVQAQTLIDAYQSVIDASHDKGILVYGCPITPFGGYTSATADMETVRTTVNDWIRNSGQFDAVIDFEPVIYDPQNPTHILQMYNNDNLHPNSAGYAKMGASIDLSLFYDLAP